VAGGTAPAVYNAANEECVAAFRAGNLRFRAIVGTVERVLAEHLRDHRSGALTLAEVLADEQRARIRARELVKEMR